MLKAILCALALIVTLAASSEAAENAAYVVVKNDTLTAIAHRFCGQAAQYRRIAADNSIANPDLIYPGQNLTISCSVKPAARVKSEPAKPFLARATTYGARLIPASIRVLSLPGGLGFNQRAPEFRALDPQAGYNMTFQEVEEYMYSVYSQVSHDTAVEALAVSLSENHTRRCDTVSPANPNGTRDYGPMQMNSVHMEEYWMYDFRNCADNIQAGFLHYSRHGWKRWTNFRNGAYKKYLDRYRNFRPSSVIRVLNAWNYSPRYPDQVAWLPTLGNMFSLSISRWGYVAPPKHHHAP